MVSPLALKAVKTQEKKEEKHNRKGRKTEDKGSKLIPPRFGMFP